MSIDRSPGSAGGVRTWLLVLLALAAMAAAAIVAFRTETPPAPPAALRLALVAPDELSIGAGPDYPFGLALASDGRRLVFPATMSGATQLWLQDLTTGDTQPLPGTADGVLPFWAPDGRALGFFAAGKLRIFTFEDGSTRDIADASAPRGGAWHPSGDIVFAPDAEGGLLRRRSDGEVEPFTILEPGETGHRHPAFLNNGRAVLLFVRSHEATRQGIWIAPYDHPAERKRVASSDGHGLPVGDAILYASGDALVAQPLDVATLGARGPTRLVGPAVGRSPHNQLFATTGGDVLVFGAPTSPLRELQWVDRGGTALATVGEPMDAWDVRVAPSDASVAVARVDPQLKTLDIWTYEGERPLPRRISLAIDVDESPAWSHDGTALAWVSARRTVMFRSARAESPEQAARKFEHPVRVSDWSADGQWLILSEARPDSRGDIWMMLASGEREATPYAQSVFNETYGVVSPDGAWLAYASDESGRFEVYVDSFPTPGRRGRLTLGGGTEPRWSGNGSELFFRRGTEVHVVRPNFSGATPEALSSVRLFDAGGDIRSYDVSADGQRVLLNLPTADSRPSPATVIVNIKSLLPSLPAGRGDR